MATWGQDDLSKFLDMVHTNQIANRVAFGDWYEVISKINDLLAKVGKNLVNPSPVMAGIFLLRAQYALKTAAGLALAGQVVETFVMMRSVLEYAGYGLVIFETPVLQNVFMNRHQSEAEMALQKNKFKIGEVRLTIGRFDQKLLENFDIFYQRTIDFGGHPNPHGTNSAILLDERGDETGITALAITADQTIITHALKTVGQVGLTILYIFQHIFKAKFEILGVRAEIDRLRQTAHL